MQILLYAFIFWLGAFFGFILKSWLTSKLRDYGGTIFVQKEDEKLLYSLELNDNPETLQFKEEVLFKIDASDKNLIRR